GPVGRRRGAGPARALVGGNSGECGGHRALSGLERGDVWPVLVSQARFRCGRWIQSRIGLGGRLGFCPASQGSGKSPRAALGNSVADAFGDILPEIRSLWRLVFIFESTAGP